jgi:excisionase family DNA binding protein
VKRFLTVDQVASELNVSDHQVRALLHAGELRGIQVGGRRLWRVGRNDVEKFIADAYARTAARIASGDIEDPATGAGEVPD